jgi:general secretion pathway protein H
MTHATASGRGSAAVPRRRSRARGVTLLELLVVLSLIGILVAMVVPTLGGGVSTTELKSSARQMAAALRLARSEALASRREHSVRVDLERRVFRVDGDAREIALPRDVELKLFTAQSDLVSDKAGAIRFFPDGGSNGGRVTLGAGERKYEVDVDWLTGRVAILD